MAWAPDYTTADLLASYLRIPDDVDDVELAAAVTAASRAIDEVTNRQFGLVDPAESRTYTARPDYECGYWVVDVDDFQTTTGLVVTIDGDPVATFAKEPLNAAAKVRPWTRIAFTADSEHQPSIAPYQVAVTAKWGWTAVPGTIVQATLLQASRIFKRRDAPFGVAGSPDQGSELRLLARVDPDVAVTLRGFTRVRAVG